MYFNEDWAFEDMAGLNSRHKVGSGLGWGSLLSLDRMILNRPEQFGRMLLESEGLTSVPGGTRAQLLSRLDPRRPEQLALLEQYISSPAYEEAEMKRFMETFPNHNLAVAPSLVSAMRKEFRDIEESARVDLDALSKVGRWLREVDLSEGARAQIGTLQNRLERYRGTIEGAIARGELSLE